MQPMDVDLHPSSNRPNSLHPNRIGSGLPDTLSTQSSMNNPNATTNRSSTSGDSNLFDADVIRSEDSTISHDSNSTSPDVGNRSVNINNEQSVLHETETSISRCCSFGDGLSVISSGSNLNSSMIISKSASNQQSSNDRLVYQAELHSTQSLEAMNCLRKNKELCDVVLLVDGREIHAHRVVLAACSAYFRAMFTGELAESRQTEVRLHDLNGDAVEILIDFCYTSRIIVEECNVQNLLPAACLLQLIEIQDVCCEFLKCQLHPSNCLGIRAFADTHACIELLKVANHFTQSNFLEVVESEEFVLLPVNHLVDIISSDELNVHTEEQVYWALMKWIHYNLADRRHYLSLLLQHVRLPLLNPKFLVGVVGPNLLIRSDDYCRDLVDEAKDYLLLPQERSSMQGPRTKPRKLLQSNELLFAVGGWCSGDAIASVEHYNSHTHKWNLVAPMHKRRCGVGVGVVNDLLFAVGGHDGQSYLNSVERYDPHTNQWSSGIAPTSTCRTSVGVAVLNGSMYAVGGQDGVSCLNFVERYDPEANKWLKVSNMTTRRLGVGVAVLNGQLYAIGGSDGQQPLSSVEHYDPRVGSWYRISCMGTKRKHLGVTVYNGLIYAVGGRDETTELSSAECLDLRTCTWSPVVAMTSRRSGVGLAVVNNQLIAIGGFDGATYLKSVELYDSDNNCWSLRGNMNSRRLGGGVGVIKLSNPCISSNYNSLFNNNNNNSKNINMTNSAITTTTIANNNNNNNNNNNIFNTNDNENHSFSSSNKTTTNTQIRIPSGLSVSFHNNINTTTSSNNYSNTQHGHLSHFHHHHRHHHHQQQPHFSPFITTSSSSSLSSSSSTHISPNTTTLRNSVYSVTISNPINTTNHDQNITSSPISLALTSSSSSSSNTIISSTTTNSFLF